MPGAITRLCHKRGSETDLAGTAPEPAVKKHVFHRTRAWTFALPRWSAIRWLPPALLALATILAVLRRSHEGRVLAAVRLDESAARTLGIDVVRYKLLAFVLGAMMAAGAGVLSTPIVRVIDPRNYVFSRAVDILAYAVLGGVAHWSGPIVGAALLTALPEWLRFLQERRDIVNGLLIMISIIFLPRGLADPRFWGGQVRALVGRRAPQQPAKDAA